jgi:hypothetical protein
VGCWKNCCASALKVKKHGLAGLACAFGHGAGLFSGMAGVAEIDDRYLCQADTPV